MPKGLTLLVADDHPVARNGIIRFLKTIKIAHKIHEAGNGIEVLRLSEKHSFDLYLLDIEMPQLNGYETAKLLLAKNPKSRIIVCTMHDGHALLNALVSLGVKGFFLKGQDIDQLEEGIHDVLIGKRYISPQLKKFLNKSMNEDSGMDFTVAELKLVKLLSKGYSSSEIAIELGLSIRSAETYRHRLIKRLRVANSAELVDYFYKNGLM